MTISEETFLPCDNNAGTEYREVHGGMGCGRSETDA